MSTKVLYIFLLLIAINTYAEDLPRFFDKGLNGIFLLEPAKELLGRHDLNCGNAIIQATCLANAARTEFAQFTTYPGGVEFSIDRFEVNLRKNDYPVFEANLANFITFKGIYLGMSRDKVVAHLGEPHKENQSALYYYSEGDSAILKAYNMPLYSAEYIFEGNRLVKFSFGFDYP